MEGFYVDIRLQFFYFVFHLRHHRQQLIVVAIIFIQYLFFCVWEALHLSTFVLLVGADLFLAQLDDPFRYLRRNSWTPHFKLKAYLRANSCHFLNDAI